MATTLDEIRSLVERLSPDYQQKILKLAQELAQMQEFINSLPEAELPPGTRLLQGEGEATRSGPADGVRPVRAAGR